MIVVISDLHLGFEHSNRQSFHEFVKDFLGRNENEISHLILLGDMLDFWRRQNEGVMFENLELLQELSGLAIKKKYYVVGNHDYSLTELHEYQNIGFEFTDVLTSRNSDDNSENAAHQMLFGRIVGDDTLKSGGQEFRFIHGYQVRYWYALPAYKAVCQALCLMGDKTGKFLSDLWDIIQGSADIMPRTRVEFTPELEEEWDELVGFLKKDPEERSISQEWQFLQRLSGQDHLIDALSDEELRNDVMDELSTIAELPSEERTLLKDFSTLRDLDGSITRVVERKVDSSDLVSELMQLYESNLMRLEARMDIGPAEKIRRWYQRKMTRLWAKLTAGLRSNEFLIYGHTHDLYVDMPGRIANAGSWVKKAKSYLSIDDGKVSEELCT